jgi:DNA-binding NarL/FixJ family response regulator
MKQQVITLVMNKKYFCREEIYNMKVLLIDDDKLVCSSLKIILSSDADICISGTGNNGQEAIELYRELKPDVLLMDIRMEIMSGLEAGEMIITEFPEAKILYLTTFLDDDYIIKALHIGAKGYMMKQNYDSILPAIKAVYVGQNVYDNEIITKLPKLIGKTSGVKSLPDYGITEKEFEIITKIADGLSNKEISEVLYLSEGTIRNNISTILEKLNLRDRTQIAVFYYKNIK